MCSTDGRRTPNKLEVPRKRPDNTCMIIKIGDIVKWSGEEFLVVGNEGTNRVQLREVTDAGYDVVLDEIEEVIDEHSYGSGHVSKQLAVPPEIYDNTCMMNKVKVGDIVNVKGEEWAMYVVGVEGDKVSYVELDSIDYCDVSDIEA